MTPRREPTTGPTTSVTTTPGVLVGAYAASPAHAVWHPDAELEFFESLASVGEVRGLELPWTGSLHPHDDAWLLAHLPRRFDVVLTSIPGTMGRLGSDCGYGLASQDESGRRAAVAEAQRMQEAARRLTDAVGRSAVVAIELHSAPVGDRGSVSSLRRSLDDLAATLRDDDPALVIEHCDAFVSGQRPEKGFLALTDELHALDGFSPAFGVSINWGRSAIELRDGDAVAQQIADASASGRLRGLMFSGAAATDTAFGPAWIDAHHPMAPSARFPQGEPASLLTESLMADALRAAKGVEWAGLKFGWADASSGVAPRVEMIRAAARVLTANMA